MSRLTLTQTRLHNGIWQGVLTSDHAAKPTIEVMFDGAHVPDVELSDQGEGEYLLRVPIPQNAIADGAQTFVIRDATDQTELGSFFLIAGEIAADDVRAEIGQLRAELDLLKDAFRKFARDSS